jgi:membrane protein DedA with SNARE-associated domain
METERFKLVAQGNRTCGSSSHRQLSGSLHNRWNSVFDWIVSLIDKAGYFGIALLMLLENVFPPIPSELIMSLAGFSAAKGTLSFAGVVLAGTIGSLAGAYFWFLIGRWIGLNRLKRFAARHGRWLTMHPDELDQARAFFSRHQGVALFVGRLIPAIRSLVSVPAGVNCIPISTFMLWSSLGTALWTFFLAGAGYLLESQYERVSEWLNPVSNVIIAGLVVWYVYRVIRFKAPEAIEGA